MPVLTIEEPTGGPDPTIISINPDLSSPGRPLECTFLWTPAPGMPPEAIADTIIAVLNAIRPPAAAHRPGNQDTFQCKFVQSDMTWSSIRLTA